MYAYLLITLLGASGDTLDETDALSLATLLLQDGHQDRAAAILEQLDPKTPGLDLAQYWRLKGIVALRGGRYPEAADFLGAAISAGDAAPRTHLLRGQALTSAQEWSAAAQFFKEHRASLRTFPEAFLLEAQVLWKLGQQHPAFWVVEAGLKTHPDHRPLLRQQLFLWVELGLYRTVLENVQSLGAEPAPEDYLAVAEALRRARQPLNAIELLEQALLRHPDAQSLRVQLAAAYLDAERPLTAAEVIRPLAWQDPNIALAAAELYRQGGALDRSQRMNARVVDQKQKLRQRLALLVEAEDYEQAAALLPRVTRLGLREDESVVYALAYAAYQIRDFEASEALLAGLKDPDLFAKGVELRRTMEVCREATWRCE